MKITSIQSYNCNMLNIDCNKRKNSPVFTAKIPAQTEKKILTEAVEFGSDALNAVKAQLGNIKKWGKTDSVLTESFDLNAGKTILGIDNQSISKMYGASLPHKKSLFDTVMSLKEKDIVNAEEDLQNIVKNNRMDLFSKAIKNQKLMNKITGKSNSTNDELTSAINKLSEERVTDLRFGLDEPSKYPLNDDIIHFDFDA